MEFSMSGRKIRKTAGRKRNGGRVFALLLGVALCVESVPVAVLAAEPEAAPQQISGNDINSISGNDPSLPAENQEPEEETQDQETDKPEDSENRKEEEEPGEEKELEQVSGNDMDSVSGNDLVSVSENTLSSVSENSLDAERAALIKAAQAAFDALLSEKPLMALLYHTDSYDVRQKADERSGKAASIEIGQTLYIQGVEITGDDVWYRAQYLIDGAEGTGYVQSYYLAYSDEDWIAWEEEYLFPILELGAETYDDTAYGMCSFSMMTYAVDTSDIDAFPKSYQTALRSLKNTHPNWTFVPMKTGLDFSTSVSREMGDKSLIQRTTDNVSKGWVGTACPSESGWYYATQPAVAYHMDPRNFLTEACIFQFEQLTFNDSYHTAEAVQGFLNGTFMKGKLADDEQGRTYAQAFYEIGKGRKLSPIHLASRVYQEQGQGTSGLISGTYSGYEGYYNFFNVGVNGSSTAEKIRKGLEYAKSKEWNTRYRSLEGGAATIGNGYILKGQDTIYLEKFNVNKNSPHGVYAHQYMQNIQAPRSESITTKNMYARAGSLNNAFVFKIPVFNNMPDENGGAEEPTDPTEPEKPLQSISLDKETVTLRRPDTVVEDTKNLSAQEKAENISETGLQVRFDPADTTSDKTIVWKSGNPKIATVRADAEDSSRAVVTAVGTGEVKITAKASKGGNQTADCVVKVIAPIYQLELSDPGAEEGAGGTNLFKGQSISLNAEYWPKDTTSDNTVTWSSSDEKIATVKNGRVTARGEGTAAITAAVAGYTASYHVAVEVCNVVFHKADGSVDKRLSLGYGDCVADSGTMPEEQQFAGKIFRGWYTGEEGQGSVFTANQPVYATETHVYPHYQEIGTDKGFYVVPVGDQTYTGSAIKPKVHVYDSSVTPEGNLPGADDKEVMELVEGRDYTLSYKNNKNVNAEGMAQPTVTVKSKGNYAGTEYVYFNIRQKSLTDHDITAEDITAAYNGRVTKGAPAVYRDGKKLAANRDYTVSYPQTGTGAYCRTGVYPIVITGKGGYTGKITVYETITSDVLLSKVSVAKIPNQIYTNEQMTKDGGIRPASLKVTYKKQPLVEGEHYTLSYSNDESVGKATVTLTAVRGSGFAGSKNVTYQIVGTPINKAQAEGIENKEYAETEYEKMLQTPGAYRLTFDGRVLEESHDNGRTGDYVVSYAGAAKKGAACAGTATVIFTGINEYSGQIKKNYKILPCELKQEDIGKEETISLSYCTQDAPDDVKALADPNGITAPYVKGGSKPVVLLRYRGQTLTPGKDYSITYKNNKTVTTADMAENKLPSFTIKGKGNFKGTITGRFTITDGQFLNDRKVIMKVSDVAYQERKGAYKAKVVLTDVNGSSLTAGRDYDKNLQYTYEEDTMAFLADGQKEERKAGASVGEQDIPVIGSAIRLTVRGSGDYAGTGGPAVRSAVYRIKEADFTKVRVTAVTKNYQDGRPVFLTADDLVVTVSGAAPLEYGKDYEIVEESYRNHTTKGKAKVTLRGIGDYGGEKTITYTIGAKIMWWST